MHLRARRIHLVKSILLLQAKKQPKSQYLFYGAGGTRLANKNHKANMSRLDKNIINLTRLEYIRLDLVDQTS